MLELPVFNASISNYSIAQLSNYQTHKLPNYQIAELPLRHAKNSLTWRADAAFPNS